MANMGFLVTLFASIIVNNVVLTGYKGLCSYLGISKKMSSAVGMGFALLFVCVIAGLISYGLHFVLDALDIAFMSTVVYILVIASLVQLVELVIKKFVPSLYKSLGIFLPLITTNCVVLGLALSVGSMTGAQWPDMLGTVIGVPLGFFLVIILFSAIRQRLDFAPVAKGFKGAAIGLVMTAFMAMAFMGFNGMLG